MDFFQLVKPSTVAKVKVLKEDCQLFSKLFISCQNRECDLQEFFHHENQSFPASLNIGGRLYVCQKSQLAAILEAKVTLLDVEPVIDVIIIDGSALVHASPPRTSKTFAEYAEMEFLPKVDHAPKCTIDLTLCLTHTRPQAFSLKLDQNEASEIDAVSQGQKSCQETCTTFYVTLKTRLSCLTTWLRRLWNIAMTTESSSQEVPMHSATIPK